MQKYCSLTYHVWAGIHMSFGVPYWKKLPGDLQEMATRHFNQSALSEREDWQKMTDEEKTKLEKGGLTFNKPDTGAVPRCAEEERLLSRNEEGVGRQGLGAASEICRAACVSAEPLAAGGANPASWAGLRRTAFQLDRVIGVATEFVGAMLVLAEVTILFAGVVSRYVFDSPIIWTDELANFLLLWLAMLGSVVAFRRDGHMRLTTLINMVGPDWGSWLGAVAALVLIAFVLEILVPANDYLHQQSFVTLITLQISDGYRVAAIMVGTCLLAVVTLLRLFQTTGLRGSCRR